MATLLDELGLPLLDQNDQPLLDGGTDRLQCRIYFGFGSTWRTENSAITWTEVTRWVNDRKQLVDVFRGATSAHGRAGAGDIGFSLNNADRRFDPLNSSEALLDEDDEMLLDEDDEPLTGGGEYFGYLVPGVPVKVEAVTPSGAVIPIGRGFVRSWPQEPDGPTMTRVPIKALDGFQNLSMAPTPVSVYDLAVRALEPDHYLPMTGQAGDFSTPDVIGSAHGTVVDEPQFGQEPLLEGLRASVAFDGVNDRIDISRTPLLPDPFHSCIAVLVRTDTAGVFGTLARIIYGQSNGNGIGKDNIFNLHVNSTGLAQLDYTVNGFGFAVVSAEPIDDGTTHLVIAQSNTGSSDYGIGVDSATLNGDLVTGFFNGGQGTAIAGTPNAARRYDDNRYEGRLSDMAIWDGTLDAAQRQTLVDALVAWDLDATGTRLGRILDFIDWPIDLRDLATGQSKLGPAVFKENDDALSYLRLIEESEDGRLFISAAGKLTFRDRYFPFLEGATSVVTFTDADKSGYVYADFQLDPASDELVLNAFRYSRRNGAELRGEDVTSRDAFGFREDTKNDLLVRTDNEVRGRGQWTLATRANPLPRVKSIVVNVHALTAAQQATILGLELGDRVSTVRTPQGVGDPIELDFVVDGIRDEIGVAEWRREFYVAPTPTSALTPFTLGTSVLGGTDVLVH